MVTNKKKKEVSRLYRENNLSDPEIASTLGLTGAQVFNIRREKDLLTAGEKGALHRSRRKFLVGSIVAAILAAASGGLYFIFKPLDFEDAVHDPSKRQEYINQIIPKKLPLYVASVEYATPDIIGTLKGIDYLPMEGSYAATVPLAIGSDPNKLILAEPHDIGKGCQSRIFVYPEIFRDWYRENPELKKLEPHLYDDLEVICTKVILMNEFTDAKNFSEGIPDYPIESLRIRDGAVNILLFNQLIDILSISAEYNSIISHKRSAKSRFLRTYASGIKEQAIASYNLLYMEELVKNMDADLVSRLRKDFDPQRLFIR